MRWVLSLVLVAASFVAVPAHAGGCDRRVSAPANLQNALSGAGQGKTVCLSGTFATRATIYPLRGQTIIGGTLRYTGGYNVTFARQPYLIDGYDLRAGNITLDHMTVEGFEGRGVVCGPRSTIQNSTFTGNHRNGVGCYAAGAAWYVRILNNVFTHNGDEHISRNSAAGVKLLNMAQPGDPLGAGGLVQGNIANDNIGNGIWWDQASSAGIARNNVANGNSHSGIRCERCAGPMLFEGNTTKNNAWDGIGVRNTAFLTARNNVSSGNDRAINVSYGGADVKRYPAYNPATLGYHPYNVRIQDTRLATGRVLGCDIRGVTCSR